MLVRNSTEKAKKNNDINLVLREANELHEIMKQTKSHVHWYTFISAVSSLSFFFSVKDLLYLIFATYTGRILYRSTLRN
jgi:hypothetical protein